MPAARWQATKEAHSKHTQAGTHQSWRSRNSNFFLFECISSIHKSATSHHRPASIARRMFIDSVCKRINFTLTVRVYTTVYSILFILFQSKSSATATVRPIHRHSTHSHKSNRQIGHNKIILLRFPSVYFIHAVAVRCARIHIYKMFMYHIIRIWQIWLCNEANHIYAIWTLTQWHVAYTHRKIMYISNVYIVRINGPS